MHPFDCVCHLCDPYPWPGDEEEPELMCERCRERPADAWLHSHSLQRTRGWLCHSCYTDEQYERAKESLKGYE